MNWIPLQDLAHLEEIHASDDISIIFKHSTRCAVSSMAKRNLEFDAALLPEQAKIYFLDLIKYRPLSNKIAELWGIPHESPQILIVQGNKCLYDASHSDIEMQDIVKHLS